MTWQAKLSDWTYAEDVLERLASGIKQVGDCWEWQRSRAGGYGQISVKSEMVGCHRVAYLLYIGEVPPGLQLDHLCRNPACCNPWHLDPVTLLVNIRRGARSRWRSALTHCPYDHAYDEANTYRHPVTGHRICRRCRADRQRRYDLAAAA